MKVLVVSAGMMPKAITAVLKAAQDVEFQGQTDDLRSARDQIIVGHPDVVVLDLDLQDSMVFLGVLSSDFPLVSPVVLLPPGRMDMLQSALLAGARGFSLKPVSGESLLSTIRDIHDAEARVRSREPTTAPSMQPAVDQEGLVTESRQKSAIVAVAGLKGGVGRSVIAVNLAVALKSKVDSAVALVDACSSMGDVASLLNIRPEHTLAQVADDPSRVDADLVRGALVNHASGLQVLISSQRMDEAEHLTPELYSAVLEHMRSIAPFVVVDTGHGSNDVLGAVVTSADHLLVVTTPELPSVRRAAMLIQEAKNAGLAEERLRLVLNRSGVQGGFTAKDITQKLGVPVSVELPDDVGVVSFSVNRGMPFVMSHPKSLMSRRINSLAAELVKIVLVSSSEGEEKKGKRTRRRKKRVKGSRQMNLQEAF